MYDMDDVLSQVFRQLSTRERYSAIQVSKQWSRALQESTTLSITCTFSSLENLNQRFPFLKHLIITYKTRENLEYLVKLAQSFTGHNSITSITSCTSAIIPGALYCRNLKQIKINEDMIMPIPHILDSKYVNQLSQMLDSKNISILNLNMPILFSINEFVQDSSRDIDTYNDIDIEYISNGIKELNLHGLGNSLSDFMVGFISQRKFHQLTKLSISSTSSFSRNWITIIFENCAELRDLKFTGLEISSFVMKELCMNATNLTSLNLHECQVSLHGFHLIQNNLIHAILDLVSNCMTNLTILSIFNTRFFNVSGYDQSNLSFNTDLINTRMRFKKLVLIGIIDSFPITCIDFFKYCVDLIDLKIDGVPRNFQLLEFLNKRCKLVKNIDIKYTRYENDGNEIIMESFVSNNLESLSINSPLSISNVLNFANFQINLVRLSLTYVKNESISDISTNLSSLEYLNLHCHGDRSQETMIRLLSITLQSTFKLRHLKINTTDLADSKNTVTRITNEVLLLIVNMKYLSVFKCLGICIEDTDLTRFSWKLLSSIEVTIIKQNEIKFQENIFNFLNLHNLLNCFIVSVVEYNQLNKDPVDDSLKIYCDEFSEIVSKFAWWIEDVRIFSPSLNGLKVRRYLLSRIASRSLIRR